MTMLGSRGGDNTLTTLSNLIANPAKLQKTIADLNAATDRHRAERDAAARAKQDAAAAVADINARLDKVARAETGVKLAQGKINSERTKLRAEQAKFERDVSAFNTEMSGRNKAFESGSTAAQKHLAEGWAELEAAKSSHERNAIQTEEKLKNRTAELDKATLQLTRDRAAVDARAKALTDLELDVRGRVKKVNELFPVT